jgi:DNA-binding Lrp family transcriptional regulator
MYWPRRPPRRPRTPEVVFAAATTGPTNLVAQVTCADSAALYRYLTGRVAALDGLNTLETAPVLHTVTRYGPVQRLASQVS